MNSIVRQRNKIVVVIFLTIIALFLWLVIALPLVREKEFRSEAIAFFDRAFQSEARVTRYQSEVYGLPFSDMGGWWELAFDQDAPNAPFEPNYMHIGLWSSDRDFIESQLKNVWPEIAGEVLDAYSFFRGDLVPVDPSQSTGEPCSYYVLQGPNRAFAYIFCN